MNCKERRPSRELRFFQAERETEVEGLLERCHGIFEIVMVLLKETPHGERAGFQRPVIRCRRYIEYAVRI